MIFFGHLGFSSIGTHLVRRVSANMRPFRWRYVLLFAVLPDLIDKPLQIIVPAFEVGRSIGHSLLGVCVLWLIITWRKSSPTYVLAYLIHFLCDGQWNHLPSLLWPLLGVHIYKEELIDLTEYVHRTFSPLNITFEVLGVAILFYIFKMKRQSL